MKPLLSILASLGLVLTLAAAPAEAQRKASGRDDGGGGSEPARTAGSRSSGGDGGESAPSRAEPAPRIIREPVGRAQPRQVQGGQPRPGVTGQAAASAAARRTADSRDAGPVQRFAAARPAGLDPRPIRIIYRPIHFPAFVGYGAWGYDPWGYHSLRYGHWYSPYAYGYWPGYFGYGYGYWEPMYGYGGAYRDDEEPRQPGEVTGSIRFRVDPKHATIYIDGALAGVVDDFDGLTNHLSLPAGTHTYELRADGYRSHTGTLTVVAGQTRTERVTLERLPASPAQ